MSSANPFSKYKALVFDCYGTLIDWETGIYEHLKPLFVRSGKPSDRQTVIQAFISVESDLEARFPTMRYTDLLAKVYTALEARLRDKVTPPDVLRDDTSIGKPVVASAHAASGTEQTLTTTPRAQQRPLVVLSNIDRDTIAKTRLLLEGGPPERPAFTFDAVYTAEDAGAYKPAPEMLAYALKHLKEDFGIEQDEVLMTAQSLLHDIVPAKRQGLDTVWINRSNAVAGLGMGGEEAANYVFSTLGEMAEAVERGGKESS
ncbi:haloalkanoic acid dehalogenase [Trametes punicea]|nr:haloalkanoic acid dehalogenase [Trametes punicea]